MIHHNGGDERRKYLRLSSDAILKIERFSFSDEKKEIQQYLAKNISAGGVLFFSPQEYRVGELLKIELSLQGWEKYKVGFIKHNSSSFDNGLVALATVIRSENINHDTFEIGLELSAVDSGHRDALNAYLTDALKK